MKEIKSVRVRCKYNSIDNNMSGIGDYKVTLYEVNNNNYKVGAIQQGRSELFAEYSKNGMFSGYSNDDFIIDGIKILIGKQEGNENYEIIQDPWNEQPPKWRSFGFDPYYLNNGSKLIINWIDNLNSVGGKKWSDDDGNELKISKGGDDKISLKKIVTIFTPDNKILKVTNLGISNESGDETIYSGNMLDNDILSSVISKWKNKVPNYNLETCNPDYIKCEFIPYINPVDELEDIDEKLHEKGDSIVEKKKLNILMNDNLQIRVNQDLPTIKVFIGDIPENQLPNLNGFDFGTDEDLSDLLLEDEFRETEFEGLSEQEIAIQKEISEGQLDSTTLESEPLDDVVHISPSNSLDGILMDAGRLARVLGKNQRVKYENLRIGYKKGVHGLCPQGTQAVLVALTGIKELGLIRGNADWFSFKNPATGGQPYSIGNGFDKSIKGISYYNSKTRINQVNGSWKGTYITDSSKWQVGDIVAMGYNNRKYGHIQIWTGYSWMSDFKQNKIQQVNVDPNTVALWRLNQNGLNLLDNNPMI